MRQHHLTIAILPLLLALAGMAAAEWLGGRGAGNRGIFSEVALPAAPAVRWQASFGRVVVGQTPSNTVVTQGVVIAAFGKYVAAVALDTGERRWQQVLREAPLGDLLLLDGQLVISYASGVALALNPLTGQQLWQTELATPISNPPLAGDAFLFYATRANGIQALERRTGRALDPVTFGNAITATPLPLGDTLAITFTDGDVMGADILGRRLAARWTTHLPNATLKVNPTGDAQFLVLATNTGLTALNRVNPAQRVAWSYPVADLLPEPVLHDQDLLFAATRSGKLLAIDLRTGRDRWARTLPGGKSEPGALLPAPAVGSPILVGMRVLVRMENGMLGAFNRDTAKLEWAYRLKAFGARFGGPAITETAVLAAASDGTITCLSTDAPDIDGPTFALPTPAGYETGLVGRGTLRFIGATVDDDGSGVAPGSVTLSLDGQDLTKYLQWNGRTGAYTIELSPANPSPAGVHRLLMTAKDMRGNLGTLSHAFIAADGTGERVSVTINGECVPRTLAVAPGTVVVWLNQSGGPRTVVAAGGAFTSDALYPTGIPAGDVWVWIVPADAKPGARYPYTDRLTGRGGELTVE